jgi:hypothetical protein
LKRVRIGLAASTTSDLESAVELISRALQGRYHKIETSGDRLLSVEVNEDDKADANAAVADARKKFPKAF